MSDDYKPSRLKLLGHNRTRSSSETLPRLNVTTDRSNSTTARLSSTPVKSREENTQIEQDVTESSNHKPRRTHSRGQSLDLTSLSASHDNMEQPQQPARQGKLRKASSKIFGKDKQGLSMPGASSDPPRQSTSSGGSSSTHSRDVAVTGKQNNLSALSQRGFKPTPQTTAALSHQVLGHRRITGWFSNMLHPNVHDSALSSSSSQSQSTTIATTPSTRSEPQVAMQQQSSSQGTQGNSFAQRITSPLRSIGSTSNNGSPASQKSTSTAASKNPIIDRRWFDKAANYLFDTDSNVDRSPEDIWVLGVKHAGYRPETPPVQTTHDDPFLANSPDDEEDTVTATITPNSKKQRLKRSGRYKTKGKDTDKAGRNSVSEPRSSFAMHRNMRRVSPASTSTTTTTSLDDPGRSRSSLSASMRQHDPFEVDNVSVLVSDTATVPLPTLEQTNGWPPGFFLDFTSRIQLTYRTGFPVIVSHSNSHSQETDTRERGASTDTNSASGQPNGQTNGQTGGGSSAFKELMGSLASTLGRSNDSGLTSDTGWGCMLRTGQSLLANALAKYHLGRDWRRPLPLQRSKDGDASTQLPAKYAHYVRILSWFLDDPSPLAPFSVHRFALAGKQFGKEIGHWFGPSTAAGAIKTLCCDFEPANLGVTSSMDGGVYKTEVQADSKDWTRPVLILLNLRLGIQGVNPIYFPSVTQLFTFPQSVGIAGGRPSSSYYFVGYQGNSLFYIDPHYPKPAVTPVLPKDDTLVYAAQTCPIVAQTHEHDDWEQVHDVTGEDWIDANLSQSPPRPPLRARSSSTYTHQHETATNGILAHEQRLDTFFMTAYAPESLDSYHPDRVRKMALTGLDPSMLVGFLIRDEADFIDWQARSALLKPSLYSVMAEPPGWAKRNTNVRTTSGASRSTAQDAAAPSLLEESDVNADDECEWDISDSGSDLDKPVDQRMDDASNEEETEWQDTLATAEESPT